MRESDLEILEHLLNRFWDLQELLLEQLLLGSLSCHHLLVFNDNITCLARASRPENVLQGDGMDSHVGQGLCAGTRRAAA